jgi:hypothetical protein
MQTAGYIGWGDHNAVGIFTFFGCKVAFFFPVAIPVLFYCVWVIGFFHEDSLNLSKVKFFILT